MKHTICIGTAAGHGNNSAAGMLRRMRHNAKDKKWDHNLTGMLSQCSRYISGVWFERNVIGMWHVHDVNGMWYEHNVSGVWYEHGISGMWHAHDANGMCYEHNIDGMCHEHGVNCMWYEHLIEGYDWQKCDWQNKRKVKEGLWYGTVWLVCYQDIKIPNNGLRALNNGLRAKNL